MWSMTPLWLTPDIALASVGVLLAAPLLTGAVHARWKAARWPNARHAHTARNSRPGGHQ